MTSAAELFTGGCTALGAEVYGRRQVADKALARSRFERLTAEHPEHCDGWLGLAAAAGERPDILDHAYLVIDTAGELLAATDVAVDAVDFSFETGLYITLPARGADGLILAVAATRICEGKFEAARDLLDARLMSADPLLAGWMLAVLNFKAKRWHDVRRTLAPLTAQPSGDPYLQQAMSVAQGLAEAYLGMWDRAIELLVPMRRGPIAAASAEALLTAAMAARALDRPEDATAWLNEAYGIDGITDDLRDRIAEALSDPSYGVVSTTAARIDARSDYWDPSTEPGDRDFVRELGAAKRAELKAEAAQELSEFVGMADVKEQIARLESSVRVARVRQDRGIAVRNQSLHLVLKGPPGTGKTTVARVIAKLLCAADVLPADGFVEVGRGDLVAKVIGGSEEIINKYVARILKKGGGVLFIDEAYALTDSGSDNDFGPLVIAELLRVMTNYADKIMVIAAGYSDKMQEFLDSNEGLRSRFTRSITLPSYSVDELVEITVRKAAKGGSLIEDAGPLQQIYTDLSTATAKDSNGRRRAALDILGNARFAENLIGFAEEELYHRLDVSGHLTEATDEELQTVTGEDLRAAVDRELNRARAEQNIELSRSATGLADGMSGEPR